MFSSAVPGRGIGDGEKVMRETSNFSHKYWSSTQQQRAQWIQHSHISKVYIQQKHHVCIYMLRICIYMCMIYIYII